MSDQDSPIGISAADVTEMIGVVTRAAADSAGRLNLNPESVERDLAKLVLVLVELLRRVMESQALARMDRGTLDDGQIASLGEALFKAKNKIDEMRDLFGIPADDFNVDLGPLGKLL
jgi:Gas vesicle protein K